MKITAKWVTGLALALFIGSGTAQAENLKLGYFNFLKVMNSVPQAKEAERRLESEFAPRKEKLTKMEEELIKEEADFKKNSLVMAEQDRESLKKQLRVKRREWNLLVQEYQEDVSLRQNKETNDIQKLVYQAVREVAEEGKYDLILQNAVYASPKSDITAKVLDKLIKKNTTN